jgi:hypothetical protein
MAQRGHRREALGRDTIDLQTVEERTVRMKVEKRFVLSLLALLAALHAGSARAQNADQSPWPTKEWLTSTPEEQGMDSAALAKLVAYGASHDFDSLIVVRHGRIVAEAYYAPYRGELQHEIFSSTILLKNSA